MFELSDEEIVYNIRIGNREALKLLYFVYEKKLGRFMYHYKIMFDRLGYTNDDIKATIWEAVNKAIGRYSFSCGPFYSFCLLQAKTIVIDLCRKKTYEGTHIRIIDNSEEDSDFCDSFKDESIDINNRIYLDEIYSIAKSMGEEYYVVLKMIAESYTYDEISKELNLPIKKIDNMALALRKKLRNKLMNRD